MKIEPQRLIILAFEAREKAYVPYSGFGVGAALLSANGKIYLGCNIESASYTPTNCAERTAFFKAVSEGEREFTAIAVVGGKQEQKMGEIPICPPCGVCRQVMMEFCNPKTFQIILASDSEHYKIHTLEAMLPLGFGPGNLL